jgi:hypothetical protein
MEERASQSDDFSRGKRNSSKSKVFDKTQNENTVQGKLVLIINIIIYF